LHGKLGPISLVKTVRKKIMSLKDKITEDMKNAMRAKEAGKLGTIRLLLSAMKQREVDERIVLDDAQILGILEKMLKQRKDSIAAFELAKRDDLVAIEKAEVEVLKDYLPAQMSEADVHAAIAAAVAQSGAVGPADMGKVMALLKPRLAGKTDLSKVSGLVKTTLSS
jgi:uncharacterized protein